MRGGGTSAASRCGKLQRAHHQVRGAVAPGGLELEFHLAGVVLSPALGAALMAASTVIVAINARLLRLKK